MPFELFWDIIGLMLSGSCRLRNCRYLQQLLAHQQLKSRYFALTGCRNHWNIWTFQSFSKPASSFGCLSRIIYPATLTTIVFWAIDPNFNAHPGWRVPNWIGAQLVRWLPEEWPLENFLLDVIFILHNNDWIHSLLPSLPAIPSSKKYIYIKNEDPPASACKNHVLSIS